MSNNTPATDEQITAVELEPVKSSSVAKFVIASLLGIFLFLIPIPRGNSFTIPIGIVINWVSGGGVQLVSSGDVSGWSKYYLGFRNSTFGYVKDDPRTLQLYRLEIPVSPDCQPHNRH